MTNEPGKCAVCGSPKSGRLDANCPVCLMRLATPPGEPMASVEANWEATRRLGDYELVEEIARGGMGAVYRARQVSLNRLVAVKVLIGGQFANQTFIERFRREAQTAASLHHPNIVSIYDVGAQEGQAYFSMELIEGRSLAELARDHPLSARRAAQLLKTIAEAVHFAHGQSLLHRDLKPSNVLVDESDTPHITDFGLAKRLKGGEDLTLTGQVVGTPSYMPPEQAEPGRGQTTAASDVYSLGAILYQLLTGRPPFLAETLTQTLRLVVESEPVTPHLLNPSVSRDMENICCKCLEKDPQRRYASAQEMADELGRFLRDEPILARPIGVAARLARWCRRKPALALSLGAGAALLLVVAIGSPIALLRIERARQQAERSRQHEAGLRVRAEEAERETELQLYTALLEQARATVQSGENGQRVRALEAVGRAAAISNSAPLRGAAIAALALPDLRYERELPTNPDATLLRLDAAFERIAHCRGRGPVEIRSVVDNRLIVTLPASTNRAAFMGAWSSDGRFLAIGRDYDQGGRQKVVEVWEVGRAKRVLLRQASPWGALAFHPRQPRLLIAESVSDAVIWDLETGLGVARHPLAGEPMALKYSPDGERFASSCRLGNEWLVSVHRASDGYMYASHTFTNIIRDLNWHPHGRWIAVPDSGSSVHLLETRTGETVLLGHHKAEAVVAEFSPDGRYLFSGGWDRQLICWDLKAMRRAFNIDLDSYRLQFSGDGRQCAILRWPEVRLQLYAWELPKLHREFAEDLGGRRKVAAFSPDGRWLAASGGNRAVVWDLAKGGPGGVAAGAWATRVWFAPNGELFADRPGECFRWRVKEGTDGATPELEPLDVNKPSGFGSLCLVSNGIVFTSQLGSRLAPYHEASDDTPRWARTLNGQTRASADGRWLGVFPPFTPYIEIYRLPEFERVARLTNRAPILDFEYSPSGNELALSSQVATEFYSTTNWQRARYQSKCTLIHYSPNTRTFWFASGFRTGGLYDARTFEAILPLPPDTLPLALSSDGRQLAVSVDSRRIQLWDLAEIRSRLGELGLNWRDPD